MKTKANTGFTGTLMQTVLAMVCFLGMQWAVGFAFEILLLNAFGNLSPENLMLLYNLGYLLLTLVVAFPLFCTIMGTKRKDLGAFFKNTGERINAKEAVQYLILSLGITSLFVLVEAFLIVSGHLDASSLLPSPDFNFFLTMIQSVAVMPIVEEMMFRGVILSRFQPHGASAAVIISSLIFALGHLNPINIFIALPTGFVLGYSALRSGSICLPLILHIVTNLFGSLLIPILLSNGISIQFFFAVGFSLLMIFASIILIVAKRDRLFSYRVTQLSD